MPLEARYVPSGSVANVRHSSAFLGPVSSLTQSRAPEIVQRPVPVPSGERIVTVPSVPYCNETDRMPFRPWKA